MNPKTAFIILNFNGGRFVIDCLDSLVGELRREKRTNWQIIVVDNASTDQSLENIKKLVRSKKIKNLQIIKNSANIGFAAGNNIGIKNALSKGAQVIMLLNQDAKVEKGFLLPLLINPAPIISPVLKFKRKEVWRYDYGGRVNWTLGRPEHVEKTSLLKNSNNLPKIDYVSGCAMMVRRKVFEQVGFFDEKYFLYFEDIDFCLRAKKAGFKVVVEPDSIVVHHLSEKSKKPFKQHLMALKSNLYFINDNVSILKKPISYFYLLFLTVKIGKNQILKR